jgi:hypothetical protein
MYVNLENAIEILGTTGSQIKIVIPIQIQLFFIYLFILYNYCTGIKLQVCTGTTVHPYRYPFYRYMSNVCVSMYVVCMYVW